MHYPAVPLPSGWALFGLGICVLLFVALSIAGALSLERGALRRSRRRKAAQLLSEQFARGQIDEHEFRDLSARLDSIPAQRTRRPRVSRRR